MNKLVKPLEWNDKYNIGEKIVDDAHQKLFGILRRVSSLLEQNDYEKNIHACIESIKYLKDYTHRHFSEEEAFMQSIGYPGFEAHKRLHDNLKMNTIPALEQDLEENSYSQESIKRYIGIFSGWLTGHILVEDQAITGKQKSRYTLPDDEKRQMITRQITRCFADIFQIDASIFNEHYNCEPFHRAVVFEMNYAVGAAEEEHQERIVFVAEETLICRVASVLLGTPYSQLHKEVLAAYTNLSESFGVSLLRVLYPGEEARLVRSSMMNEKILKKYFDAHLPEYSVAWKSDCGFLAVCIDHARESAGK
ncbi:MAG: bacteriohemerythrin [Anaerovoracaceae bacterium]